MGMSTIRERLLQENRDDDGTRKLWVVLGEDPNCDYTGSHIQPELGVYEGTLAQVVSLALGLPRFTTFGVGGNVREVKVTRLPGA